MATKSEFTSEQKKLYATQVSRLKNIFSNGRCMFDSPHCAEPPINSHTISKARYLTHIAESNQVLQWGTDHWADDIHGATALLLKYTTTASTFPGFCSQHDSSLFKCVDEDEFIASPKQLFMLAYRTHSREVHCKRAQILAFPQPEDVARLRGHPEPKKAVYSLFGESNIQSMEIGLRDALIHQAKLNQVLLDADYRRLCSWIVPFKFASLPFVASAGSFYPDFDVYGHAIQDFCNATSVLNTLHFAILPSSGQSYAVFSFLDTEASGPKQLVDSMATSSRLGDLLAWVPFSYIENTVVRPSWWQGLPEMMKLDIHATFRDNMNIFTPMSASISKCPASFKTGIVPGRPFWI